MGGKSRWNALEDDGISRAMPEVFAPPPTIVSSFMAQEAENALREWNPLVWMVMKGCGLYVTEVPPAVKSDESPSLPSEYAEWFLAILRRNFFGRFERR
jgi:hypothetical protein